ncbi:MAG TPA: type II toxin-antitoxin system PemK/MazF family toxin [Candidatus Rubrimentiphilum sp.]|nr:type II toxin-antitoxin system PemK/MazF family toxin [Candidatus Rubrimentiphilum sp.]
MKAYVPKRGDIAWLDFSPQVGHEQAGRRPALVLTGQRYNALCELALVCPISSKQKGYLFEVKLPPQMRTEGVVITDQVRSFAWKGRHAEFKEAAPPELLDEVLERVGALLEL